MARDAGEFKSQSLMESSQLPVKNVFLLTTFQFTQYTCVVTCNAYQSHFRPLVESHAVAFQECGQSRDTMHL